MFEAAIVGGDWDHGFWLIFFGSRGGWQVLGCVTEGEQIDVHLSCEAFGQVGRCDPACERNQVICQDISLALRQQSDVR